MIRVLQVYKNYLPTVGGIETHVRLLSRELKRLGDVEPTVLVTNTSRCTVVEEVD